MIDHVGLGVSDLERSRAFYEQALAPLGYQVLIERDGSAGFGSDGKPGSIAWKSRRLPVDGCGVGPEAPPATTLSCRGDYGM